MEPYSLYGTGLRTYSVSRMLCYNVAWHSNSICLPLCDCAIGADVVPYLRIHTKHRCHWVNEVRFAMDMAQDDC